MRYVSDVDGKRYEVDVDETAGGLRLTIDGQVTAADIRQVTAPTLFSLIKDGRSYEVFAEPSDKGYVIVISGERFLVDVADERSLRLASVQKRDIERRGDMVIKAPMPGLVVDVYIQPGELVKTGQSLLILMAMKMENEIRAFEGGTVKLVQVKKGDKVEVGQTLATIA